MWSTDFPYGFRTNPTGTSHVETHTFQQGKRVKLTCKTHLFLNCYYTQIIQKLSITSKIGGHDCTIEPHSKIVFPFFLNI